MGSTMRLRGTAKSGQRGVVAGAIAQGNCLLCTAACAVSHAAAMATFDCKICMPYRISYPAILVLAKKSAEHRRLLKRGALQAYASGCILTITVASDRGFRLSLSFSEIYAHRIDAAGRRK